MYGDGLLYNPGTSEVEFEAQLLEQRLKQQQLESEEDSRWLAEEEINLVSIFPLFFCPLFILSY